ncbi:MULTISPECIES: lipid A biosynthesis lauroyl acyltransferase [unclassified Chelatococcus]|uniref:lipid A biosynthesis lauroyl acyltransferase n=1 Tax=unclassified Chelatococcus TaxID=2638111 RepID=UPI00224BE1C2|nr:MULTISPECIES: lipid A biosynthesis lauroyl acyltransferase [unclassified Chelatococcus]CAH1657825.1 Lipid A biosynthesis lauroyl acyltransferase [Hyphomicrobiales bacterium]CAH1684318.1 Lipid A biosynthesis lauroyl acyltransferase [Hyphomicrobiales bacterium]
MTARRQISLGGIVRRLAARVAEVTMIGLVRAVFALFRALGPDRSSALGGAVARAIGPLFPAHRTAMTNLREAFPDKSEAERRAIARSAWDNLGRTGAEYAHLSVLFDYDHDNPQLDARVEVDGIEHFMALRDDGKPGIIFSAHLGNWELPAICAARYGLAATAVFRAPNDPGIAHVVHEVRSQTMGGLEAARQGAAFAMARVLEDGGHLGMLIDQHFTRGVTVPFFGRPARTNPILGKFARRFDCPVHGVRVQRLPGGRFRLQLTPPLDLPRDSEGLVDVEGAMAAMTAVVETWVREDPGQWLWMHRRWRPPVVALKAT